MEKILQPTHKQLRRIAAIRSAEQITQMSVASISLLTSDFDEQIVRMIIARIPTAEEQLKGLNSIKKSFDHLYLIEEDFDGTYYTRDLPTYFGELILDLELGILVTAPSSPVETPTEEATPADWIATGKCINETLEISEYLMQDLLCMMSTLSKERIEMLNSMRNGMLKKLTDELSSCQARNKELESTVDRLMAEIAQLKLEEQESLEPSPYQKAMAYENVIYYIASRPLKHKREDLINMLEALLPKEMHAKLRNDIEEKVEARDAEKASKRRKSKASARLTPQITAQAGSTINIIDGTNINHAENVSSK